MNEIRQEQKKTPAWGVVITILIVVAVIFAIKGACRQSTMNPLPPASSGTNSPA